MDESGEASVGSFRIGPSTLLGRGVALRVLLFSSLWRLRARAYAAISRVRSAALPVAVSWLHLRNTHGVLLMVVLFALFLTKLSGARSRAALARRRRQYEKAMLHAGTYEVWARAAKVLDKMSDQVHEADFYDEELIRNRLEELRRRREDGSLREVVFCMRGDLVRNLGNMCNPELHKGRLEVPKLIKEYIEEVSTQLRMVCESDSDELLLEEKLAFVQETRHAFGRTALLLSGGASLGSFHVGVVKTLVEHKLLPRIIAGSSVGSIICSIVATRTWPEIESFFTDSLQTLQFFDRIGGIFAVMRRVTTYGALHDISQMQRLLRNLTGNLTFQEAYDMTGRVLGITVCSPRKNEPPRCLNYLMSPHVVIWSAVTASCAFPGLFEAQELMAKDRFGNIVPFHAPFATDPELGPGASKRRWRDGSLEMDLPMMRLKELFNLARLAEMEVKYRCNQILEIGLPMGGLAKLFAQDWEGDVTMVMPATVAQQGAALIVGTPALSHHVRCNSHDGSESESETIDLNSWTRSGGPLMRTASADKFISFIHNLEIDTELSRPCTVEGGTAGRCTENSETEACNTVNTRASQAPTPTSIAVSEGDLLQPESTTNGILLNIVKRDALQAQNDSVTELAESSCAEAYVTTCDAISGSDCAEDNKDAPDSSNHSLDNDDFVVSRQPSADD
ncbi:unnamed protein product [Miscanthus lutarioriparius]|uniref:PNPLA domain-containing protein n=1 Tax=Miscanthus lutarioriparius TaxID=422564 RepID=A0A811MZY9_9POAL|nr:unnamed protein product [Miscanthus lutarioriparius]